MGSSFMPRERRAPIQTALQRAATIEPTAQDLVVTLTPLSSAHRLRAVAALSQTLNEAASFFPGTTVRMQAAAAEP
jgi:hypothetical protein